MWIDPKMKAQLDRRLLLLYSLWCGSTVPLVVVASAVDVSDRSRAMLGAGLLIAAAATCLLAFTATDGGQESKEFAVAVTGSGALLLAACLWPRHALAPCISYQVFTLYLAWQSVKRNRVTNSQSPEERSDSR